MPVGGSKDRPIDISLVCATHRDLKALVATGEFREDLYYRIDGLCVTLPPLRERADLSELIGQIVDREIGDRLTLSLSDDALECLRSFAWPGNIRQLLNVVQNMVVSALAEADAHNKAHEPITLDTRHIPDDIRATDADDGAGPGAGSLAGTSLGQIEKRAIRETLRLTAGNREQAAALLGIGERTLYRKLKEYGLR